MRRTYRGAAWKTNCGLAAILFVVLLLGLSTMIYADSYEHTLEEQRKQTYGAWHIGMYNADGEAWDSLSTHATVAAAGRINLYALILDANGASIGGAGSMDGAMQEIGNITMLDGRLPETKQELAMEASYLTKLGYSYELGQTISLTLAVPNEDNGWDEVPCQFTLCGVVDNYTGLWKTETSTPLVSAFLSDTYCSGLSCISMNCFAELKTEYAKFAASLSSLCPKGSKFVLNDYTYLQYAQENPPKTDRLVLQCVILVLGIAALAVLFHTELQQRRNSFVLMRTIGATKGQIVGIFLQEKGSVMFLSFAAGIVGGIGLPYLLFRLISKLQRSQVFILLDWDNIAKTVLLYLTGLIVALFIGLLQLFEIPLRGIPQQQASVTHIAKRRPLQVGNLFVVLHRTNRKKQIQSVLLSFTTVAFVLLSSYQAWSRYQSYTQMLQNYPADYCFGYMQVLWAPSVRMTAKEYAQVNSSYGIAKVQGFSVSDYRPILLPGGTDDSYTSAAKLYLAQAAEDPEMLHGALVGISKNLESDFLAETDSNLVAQQSLEEGEVILYMPTLQQQEDGSIYMAGLDEFAPNDSVSLEDHVVSVGDSILWNYVHEQTTLTVAGIITAFEDDFPIALNPSRPFAMLCSEDTYRQVTGDDGYSYVLVYGDPNAVQYQADVELSKIRTNLPFTNYRLENQAERQQLNLQVMLSLVLSMSGFLLVWLLRGGIQYSTEQQERPRYRVLYGIGMSKATMLREQLRSSLLDSLTGCALGTVALVMYRYVQASAALRTVCDYMPSGKWAACCDAVVDVFRHTDWRFVLLVVLTLFFINTMLLFLQKIRMVESSI